MDLRLNGEQEALQKAVREVLEKEAKTIARELEETEKGYSSELWQKMVDLGWMGVSFPEEYGGTGGDFMDLVLLLEEMGKILVPGPFIPAITCAGHAILQYGSEAQKKEFLPSLTKGKILIIPALIEPTLPEAGRPVKEKVTVKNGDYILSGTRLFVPYAHLADWFIYGTETNKGETLFLVNAKSPGVKCSLLKTIASDKQCEVVLDKVKVPKANIFGKIGKGKEIMRKIEEWGSLSQCAFILGLVEQVLKMSVEYAKERIQFERQIGSFQAIQHQCANMATDVDQVKFLTYQAAWKLSEQLPATKEISMAKARASDASQRVCLLGTKIHGGIGIIVDYDMQLYFRRAKAAELAFGDADFHREIIAQQLGL
ncbi:MAG TPA: acyl-CoA dehydrogenase family protein [candidate division Zixibacteria bacterium]